LAQESLIQYDSLFEEFQESNKSNESTKKVVIEMKE